MLIGIDGNEANVEKKVGVSEYAFELLRQFYVQRGATNSMSFWSDPANRGNDRISKDAIAPPSAGLQHDRHHFQIYLKDRPKDDLPKERDGWKYRVVRPRKLWTQIRLPVDLYLRKPRPDVFFTPTHYAPRFCPVPSVISIMDLSYVHFPQMFKKSDLYQLKNWTSYSVKNAARILTISEASKNDIIEHYQVEPERVVVTYPGTKQVSSSKYKVLSMTEIKKKYGIDGEYILFVGTLQPRKNIVCLIESFAKILSDKDTKIISDEKEKSPNILISQYPNISLIIVGKPGWLYEEIYGAPKKFGVEEQVKFLDYVPDDDLPALYQNALCFVLPSLYEGFGLPILEAMSYGCPVITSNVSSLPEAAGEAAILVDPESVESIKEGIKKVTSDKSLREKLVKKGYEQVKKFSWEKCAKETLVVLEEVGKTIR